jgi:hypothetical protein
MALGLAGGAALVCGAPASAQEFPARPERWTTLVRAAGIQAD